MSEREQYSEGAVLELTKKEAIYLTTEKNLWTLGFGQEYFKQSLNLKDLIYFGELKENRPNGKGIIYTISYSYSGKAVFVPLYIGTFKDGVYNGYGKKYTKASKFYNVGGLRARNDYSNLDQLGVIIQVYEGYFKDGEYEGKGIYRVLDEPGLLTEPLNLKKYIETNTVIINDFLKEFKESKSPVLFSQLPPLNTVIKDTGEFKNGQLDGEVKRYTNKGQLKYEGGLKEDQYQGKGKLYYENGKLQYEGEFKNGKYTGKGTLFNEDGSIKYKGEWRNGNIK